MIRLHISQVVDGVNFHAEVDGLAEAEEVQAFFAKRAKEAIVELEPLQSGQVDGAGLRTMAPEPTIPHTPAQVKAGAKGEKWTRENLQSVVVALVTSKREAFAELLKQFGAARFRDLPDDKLNDFGAACEGLQAVEA